MERGGGRPIRTLSKTFVQAIADEYPMLERLKLSHNEIRVIENLEVLTALRVIDLSSNSISSLPSMFLPLLQELNLSHNTITAIGDMQGLPQLRNLDLSDNLLLSLTTLKPLLQLSNLRILDLRGNPVADAGGLRETIQSSLGRLETLNGISTSSIQISPQSLSTLSPLSSSSTSRSGLGLDDVERGKRNERLISLAPLRQNSIPFSNSQSSNEGNQDISCFHSNELSRNEDNPTRLQIQLNSMKDLARIQDEALARAGAGGIYPPISSETLSHRLALYREALLKHMIDARTQRYEISKALQQAENAEQRAQTAELSLEAAKTALKRTEAAIVAENTMLKGKTERAEQRLQIMLQTMGNIEEAQEAEKNMKEVLMTTIQSLGDLKEIQIHKLKEMEERVKECYDRTQILDEVISTLLLISNKKRGNNTIDPHSLFIQPNVIRAALESPHPAFDLLTQWATQTVPYIEELQAELIGMQEQMKDSTKLHEGTIQALRMQLEDAEKETKKTLNEAKENVGNMERKLSTMKEEIELVKKDKDRIEIEYTNVGVRLKETSDKAKGLEKIISELKAELSKEKMGRSQLEDKLNKMTQEKEVLSIKLRELEKREEKRLRERTDKATQSKSFTTPIKKRKLLKEDEVMKAIENSQHTQRNPEVNLQNKISRNISVSPPSSSLSFHSSISSSTSKNCVPFPPKHTDLSLQNSIFAPPVMSHISGDSSRQLPLEGNPLDQDELEPSSCLDVDAEELERLNEEINNLLSGKL